MIYAALFALIIGAACSHGVMDSITFIRIHLAMHPLADGWHLAQWFRISCYIGTGYLWPRCWRRDRIATLIAVVSAIVLGLFLWDAIVDCPEYWLEWDRSIHISTGWAFLDKLLGIHW